MQGTLSTEQPNGYDASQLIDASALGHAAMLRILGHPSLIDGRWTRRDVLRAGGLGLLGMAGQPVRDSGISQAASSTAWLPCFGRAKRCLLLYIYGAWSQLDTFDPKPDAPAEIRGEFASIESVVPGARVCEHLPRAARVLDRCTLIRSMAHPYPIHSAAYTLTGNADTERLEGRPRNPEHWPFMGGALEYLADRAAPAGGRRGVPGNVLLPWMQSSRSRPNKRAGTFGGFLGNGYDPIWAEFEGEAPLENPYHGITPEGKFEFALSPEVTLDALDRRRSLLAQFEQAGSAGLDQTEAGRGYSLQQQRAFDFAAARGLQQALRIDEEPSELRERYGMTLFGQSALAGRRLIEAGVPFVTVMWDEWGQTDESWDTHYEHHDRMRDFLLPGFDRGFSALIEDMDQRGLLDDTLVLCLSEHGRTPQFYDTFRGPGRGHWSGAYCQLFAGAGVPRGQVVGASDRTAAHVTHRPIDPKDILCTAYHLLGIDPRTEITNRQGRPLPLVSGGEVVRELLG
jgi:hypothetical protein